MFIFLGILILGLAYVWVKGDLDWIKPQPVKPTVDTQIPTSLYETLNKQQSTYVTKEFSLETTASDIVPANDTTATPLPIRKPMFKPTFKKPGNES
jgi:NADH-quinone oxidoreductase subunit A